MRRGFGLLAVLALAAALGTTAREPIAFQKVASFTEAPLPAFEARAAIDIASIVRAIPDRGEAGTSDTVYEVDPARRYRRSIVDGFGNCSNLVKGLSWRLIEEGYEFEIVYVMPVLNFLDGAGHTLLRANLALPEGERVGLADLAAAAIPRSRGRVLDVADLNGPLPDFQLDPLRPESEDWRPFWAPELRRASAIGRTSASEVARWNRFLAATYVDLGLPDRLEKMIYVGIGVVLGFYPAVHVDTLAALRAEHPHQFAQMVAALWAFRLAPLVLLGCWLSWLLERAGRAHAASRERLAIGDPAKVSPGTRFHS